MNKLARDEILLYVIVSCIVTAIVSVGIGYLLRKRIAEARIGSAEEKADSIMKEAEKSRESALREAETLKKETLVQTREEMHKLRETVERESRERRDELQKYEQRLVQKENNLDQRSGNLEQRELSLAKKESQVKVQKEKAEALYVEQQAKLEEISQLSREQAKDMILDRINEELTHEKALRIRENEEEIKEIADTKAREIVAAAIQRNAADTVSETTVSVVSLPNEEMKGRI
ncbi:MAG: Rnase Y domain-containing protein, partial [Dialister sp.]|nr:Rnase Y domain-containing protein [Dialister sp.]